MSSTPIIVDRRLLRARRRRAERIGTADFLIERVAHDIAERLSAVLREFDLAVDLGTPGDAVRRALAASGKVGTVAAPRRRRQWQPAGRSGRRGDAFATAR
jgi:hypothetical protein